MEIITILLANIKRKKGSFIGIVILMFLITLSMTSIISLNDNQEKRIDQSYRLNDTGDVVAFVEDRYTTKEMLSKLDQDEYTSKYKNDDIVVLQDCDINNIKLNGYLSASQFNKSKFTYQLFNKSENGFTKHIKELKKGEVYVPYTMKTMYKCKIGSNILIRTSYGEEIFTIKGFIEEPLRGAYVIYTKNIFVCKDDFNNLMQHVDNPDMKFDAKLLKYHMISLYSDNMDIYSYEKMIDEKTGVISHSYATLAKQESRKYTLMLTGIFGNMLIIFIILLIVIVLIVMGHSISTGIEMDYVNLGVYKAVGFSQKKLRGILFLQYLIAEIIGAVLGVILSSVFIRVLGRTFQLITGLWSTGDISLLKCGLIIVAILLISAVFIYLKTYKICKISPVRAISGGKESVYFDDRGRVGIKRNALGLRISWRQLTSNKKQYIGIVMVVSILVYFLVSITVLTKAGKIEKVYEIFGGIKSDIKLELTQDYTSAEKETILNKINRISPVTYSVFTAIRYYTIEGTQYNTTIYDDPKQFNSVTKGRKPIYDNEIVITDYVAKKIGKNIGDTVTISHKEKKAEYIVSGIYSSTVEVGKCIGMSLAAARKVDNLEPNIGYIRIEDSRKINEVMKACNSEFSNLLNAKLSSNEDNLSNLIRTSLNLVTGFIYCITVAFIFIVVSMVCKKAFLNERQDIGIYKALGFTVGALRKQFAMRFFIVSCMGSLVGIALNLAFNENMMTYLLKSMGLSSFSATYTISTILVPIVVVCACFFIFSYWQARVIRSVSARELVTE